MRVAVTGSSGLVGTALTSSLTSDGHEVVRLVRREPERPDEVEWDPSRGRLDHTTLEGVDAVVNLAGAGIADRRWTTTYKRIILASRANATRTVAEAVAKLDNPPQVLVSASTVGIYGVNHGPEVLDEERPPGEDFLAHMCMEWEAATIPAAVADITVCHARLGLVLSASAGVLRRMLPWFRAGLGGPLGGGDQYWSYVSLTDAVRAIRYMAETPGCAGPYNVVAPQPATNAELGRVLARALHRPMLLPVPAFAVRARYGELAEDILASLRAVPRRLLEAGFEFNHPDARSAIAAALR